MYKFYSLVANLALFVAIISANTTCKLIAYQPALPENAKILRRF